MLRPQINPDAFPILLAHHPHAFDPAAEAGIPLTLSGHTHGGQIMLTDRIGGGPMISVLVRTLSQPNSSLVVSNGVGVWFPSASTRRRNHSPHAASSQQLIDS